MKKRIAAFVSGRGSNMEALIHATKKTDYPAIIACVFSDHENAGALDIAKAHGIPTLALPRKKFDKAEHHEAEIESWLNNHEIDLIALAGYMRLLTANFVEKRLGKIINIHPSLLPSFKGLNTHERALQSGVRIHGCTVHFVTPDMDEGPIIMQAGVPVLYSDSCETLSTRVLQMEHKIYPLSIKWIAEGKIYMEKEKIILRATEESDPQKSIYAPFLK